MSTTGTTQARGNSTRPRRIGPLYLLSLLVVVALQVLNVALLRPLAPAPAVRADVATYPYTDVNPYGANTFLSREVEDWKRVKTLQMMSDAGLGWVKQQFPWSEIEPKQGVYWDSKFGQDSWEKYDRIVALSETHGLRVIARLDNTPEWARPANTTPQAPPTNPEHYATFVAKFVERYKGRVQYLQIWNEPNLKDEWGGRLDPAGYADLLCRTYARAKAANPNVVILAAPLAQTLETGGRGLNELLYLQQLYDAGVRGCSDIMLANGYGFDQPPDAAPDPQVLNLRRVELLREVMERNGDGAKPVWLNEYGWNAAPPSFPVDKLIWQRVSPEQQAAYTVQGIRYARQNWPWVGVINIWFFRQVGDIAPSDPTYYFRVVEQEFTPTPLYHALQNATAEQRRATPGSYGPLSPALASRGRWSTVQTGRELALRSDHPNDQLTIQFQGNQLVLHGLRGPQGGRLGVEIDGSVEAVEHLPRDAQGRHYVDFQAANEGPATIPVVSGLDPVGPIQEHQAVLKVLPAADGQGAGEVVLFGIEVAYARSPIPFAVFSTLVALLALGATALAIRAVGRLRRGRRHA